MSAASTTRPTARFSVRVLLTVAYLVMLGVNGLANALPLNGVGTGDVSDAYGNLFAPAGLTFAIWGVIYVLLGAHVLYQWGLFREREAAAGGEMGGAVTREDSRAAVLDRVGVLFAVSSLANTAWIFAWHWDLIALSTLFMLILLGCLIMIARLLVTAPLTPRERWFVRVPFSVYFGWITVATVANVTVLLVQQEWGGFGLAEAVWAVLIIAVAAAIGTAVILRHADIAYGLVLVWAFLGILIKHVSAAGFDTQYPAVIGVVIACLAMFVVAGAVVLLARRRRAAEG